METIKQRMSGYWARRAGKFAELRIKEFSANKHELWLNEIRRYLPEGKGLNILDLGTGTGFFTFLLTAEGHHVTGIDLTEEMIREARQSAQILGIPADFYVMDAETPDFAEGSFDVLISRNLTWGLPHLAETYAAWHRMLKPGGVLINFDADYCREKEVQELPENHSHKGIAPDMMQEYRGLKNDLRSLQQPRPDWDVSLLSQAGFSDIQVDESVWARIYGEKDEFYNPTPIFTVTARA